MEHIGYGIIGCGGISRSHLRALTDIEGASAVAVTDINPKVLSERADEFGVEKRYADWRELLRDDAVQAVSICLPPHLHAEVAIAAAQAKKHVLVEKPMANSLADCDAMIRAADENGVQLMVGQVLRRYPANKLAKQLIQDGKIGRVASVQRRRMSNSIFHLESYSWAAKPEITGGWLLYGYGPHEFDTILWLLDTEVESLFALGRKNRVEWNDYDEITSLMQLQNGAMASMVQSLNCDVSAWDCIIIGDQGTIAVEPQKVLLNGEPLEAPLDGEAVWREQLQEFVNAVRENREPDASGRCVRPTMQALEAVRMSLAQDRKVEVASL